MAGLVPVRAGDCDSYGHVNNAAYVAYLQDAVARRVLALGLHADLALDGAYRWTLRRLSAEYRAPVVFGAQVESNLWVIEPDEIAPTLGYEVRVVDPCDGTARVAFRAKSVWQREDRASGEPQPLPAAWLADLADADDGGRPPRRRRSLPDTVDTHVYRWQHAVQLGELSPANRVQPEALFRWLEESLVVASAEAGWPASRMLETGVIVLQTRHDTVFHAWPGPGERVAIDNRVIEMRRRGGTWRQTMRRVEDDAVLAQNYSTGIFLDLLGQPIQPPDAIIESLKYGGRENR